jgi:hypothetical protein
MDKVLFQLQVNLALGSKILGRADHNQTPPTTLEVVEQPPAPIPIFLENR